MRAFPALLLTALLVLLLVACGGNDEDDEPTAEPAQPTQAAATTVVEPSPTLDATPGTPVAATAVASPAASSVASPAASPVASPVTAATPASSGAEIVAPVPGEAGDSGPTQLLRGTVSLPGTVNERFVLAGDGCVGLGTYAGLQAGQQVVVRNETGEIVGVTELAATESTTVCAWTFEVEVPSSPFYAVSLPMVGEHVYTAGEVENGDGRIELVLP